MSTHELTTADCSWPLIEFESPMHAFVFADQLEQQLDNPNLTPVRRAQLEAQLDDLFAFLFDSEA